MSTSVAQPALGLALDQHPGLAPKGAMSQADNVVGDLPGVLRGRPNTFVAYSEDALDPDDYARIDTLVRVDEEWLAHQDGSASDRAWRNASGVLTGVIDGAYPTTEEPAASAAARGSVYLCTDEGVAKLVSSSAQELTLAGVEMSLASAAGNLPGAAPSGGFGDPPPGPFTSPFSIGYRLVIKRTDANGYVARSAPSQVFAVLSPTTTTWTNVCTVLWGDTGTRRWYFPDGHVREGDVVEFYRSRTNTLNIDGPVGPDYYLVTSYEITATNVSDGFFPASGSGSYGFDTLTDDQLGQALYTNPGRDGALAAKYAPPTSSVASYWAGVMWYGYIRERERAQFRLASVGQDDADEVVARGSDGQSFGVFTDPSAGITLGSPSITVADVTGIRVGMYVSDSLSGPSFSTAFPVLTRVLSISGAGPYTVTVSANATLTDASAYLIFSDYIDIDGKRYFAVVSGSADGIAVSGDPTAATRSSETASELALTVNAWSFQNGGGVRIAGTNPASAGIIGVTGSFVVESLTPDGGFTVGPTSAPYAFSPAIEKQVPYGATVHRNRLYWSDPEEPEAVRLLSYVDIGEEQSAILGLSALRDALLVWKEDGLFRVTGTAPSSWTVDVLDPTLVLSRKGAVDVLRGMAYAVTNRGVVAVSEGGVSSLPAQGKVETLFRNPVIPQVVAWEKTGLVLFSELVGPAQDTFFADTIYCLATATGVWSRWPNIVHSTMSQGGRGAYPFIATTRPDRLPLFEVRRFLTEADGRGYDQDWESIAYAVGTGGTMVVTDAQRGDWYPQVGDWVGAFGPTYRVLGVSYNGMAGEWTLTLDVVLVSGGGDPFPVTAYEGAPVQLEWLPSVSGSAAPFSLPLWREAAVSFSNGPATDLAVDDARLVFGVRHDQSQTVPEVVGTPQRSVAAMRPYRFRWPRQAARRSVVWPRLGFSEIGWAWRLSGLAITGEGGSERTRR